MKVVVSMVPTEIVVVPSVETVVPRVHMSRLNIPMVVVVVAVPGNWKVWSITDLRVHRGGIVGRSSLHRREGSSSCNCNAGEEESRDTHDW